MKRWLCTLVVFVLSMCAFGMTALAEGEPVSMTVGETTTGYETVAAAVAAAPKDGTKAVITLNENFTGAGVKVSEGQNIVFDLNTFTWQVTDTVGSTGTETNGLQLLKDSTVEIRNGALTSQTAKLLVQNYCNLTIDGVQMSGADNLTQLIVSNNNGKTVIKGGSRITAAAGGAAFDSDQWGGYDGGDVYLEDGVVTGDVQATNGGRITLSGGTVDGTVRAYNYTAAGYDDKTPSIQITGSVITGDVVNQDHGQIVISGGSVAGKISTEAESKKVTVTGGSFATALDENSVDVQSDYMAVSGTQTAVGQANVTALLAALKAGDSVRLVQMPAQTQIVLPAGVTVENATGNTVLVNDMSLEPGKNITIAEEKPETVPQTGSGYSAMVLCALIMATAAVGAVVMRAGRAKG